MKKVLKAVVALILLLVLVSAGGAAYLSRSLEAGKKVEIHGVNIKNLSDGNYSGKYEAGRWSNKVNVSVKDKKITDIKIEKDVTFAKPEVSSELFNRVIEAQNTNVDAVSGATVTSKAYLKSIENALNK
ncbi:MAG: FMN-binding protein [Solirubrobacterales bacterium]